MKAGQTLWTKDQLILAINLYCKIPFGQMHANNPEIKNLATIIGRTPSAVARKLGNFASFDPKLSERGVKGLSNASKLDKEIWNAYMNNWDDLFIESEQMLASLKNSTIEQLNYADFDDTGFPEGKEAVRYTLTRVNQSLFRKIVLSNYNYQCCITGIDATSLIVASHILPWSKDKGNRLNPKNGLALNVLHDKAFDKGLLTITEELKIKISPILLKKGNIISVKQNFIDYNGCSIFEPQKFYPDIEFLKAHNDLLLT